MLIRKKLTTKKLWLLAGIIMAILVFLGILLFVKNQSNNQGNIAKFGALKPLVAVETVQRQNMMKKFVLSGQTVAAAQVDIAAKNKGYINDVKVELGQHVTAGQLLAVQDTREIELEIHQTEAVIRQAKAEIMETKTTFDANYHKTEADYQRNLDNYQRYELLYNTGAISREALDSAKQQMINSKSAFATLAEQNMAGGVPAVVEIKQAALAHAEYSLEVLKQQHNDMIFRAPQSGIIGYRQVDAGTFVAAGQKLLTVVDNSSIFLDCQVSEKNAAHIRAGVDVSVTIESLGFEYPGTIVYISPASDSKLRAFIVRIALKQSNDLIKSGMFAHADVEVLLRPQTLFVAKEAINEVNGKNYVFVIQENNQVEHRLVKTGLHNDDSVEILEGLREGERIAISNIARLKPNMAVELEQKNNKTTKGISSAKQSEEGS